MDTAKAVRGQGPASSFRAQKTEWVSSHLSTLTAPPTCSTSHMRSHSKLGGSLLKIGHCHSYIPRISKNHGEVSFVELFCHLVSGFNIATSQVFLFCDNENKQMYHKSYIKLNTLNCTKSKANRRDEKASVGIKKTRFFQRRKVRIIEYWFLLFSNNFLAVIIKW